MMARHALLLAVAMAALMPLAAAQSEPGARLAGGSNTCSSAARMHGAWRGSGLATSSSLVFPPAWRLALTAASAAARACVCTPSAQT